MDKMYEYFYLAMLISASLLALMTLVRGVIGKRYRKVWGYIQQGLIVITAVAMIGFIVALI